MERVSEQLTSTICITAVDDHIPVQGAAVKMELQPALDPRKQELLEARCIGVRVHLRFASNVLVHSKLANMAFPVNEDVAENAIKAKDGQPLTKVKEQPITDCVIQ